MRRTLKKALLFALAVELYAATVSAQNPPDAPPAAAPGETPPAGDVPAVAPPAGDAPPAADAPPASDAPPAGDAPPVKKKKRPKVVTGPDDFGAAPLGGPVPPPLPDIPGLPPADDIPPLPDIPGLPPADDIPGQPTAARKKKSDEDAGETVVRVKRKQRAVTSTRTSVAEAQRLPGTQGDAIRVVESLPGVGRPSFASGELLLWGASPDSSRVYLDGVPIPRLFHGGGLRSTFNGFFVKEIELVPGAYGADYGGATAGMVRVATGPLQEGTHGIVSADVLDGSIAASTQPYKKLFLGGGFRYGYLNRIAPLVASDEALQYTLIPKYRDYQSRAEWRFSESARLSLLVFGSYDRSASNFTSDDPARARSSSRGADFNRGVIQYTDQTKGGATVRFMAYFGNDHSIRRDAVGPYAFSLENSSKAFGLRSSWLGDIGKGVRLHLGVSVESWFSELTRSGSLSRPPREGDLYVFGQAPTGDNASDAWRVSQVNVSPYVEMPVAFWKKKIDLTPGVRLSSTFNNVSTEVPPLGDSPTNGVAKNITYFEPRLMANFKATDALSFKAGGGLYSAPPNPADLSAVFGTPTLGSPRSKQVIGGGGYEFTKNLNFETVGFYRVINHQVGRNTDTSIPPGHLLTQDGEARAYGAQATLRHRLAKGFTGWLAYTYSKSQVRYHPHDAWRLSDYNQTHLFTAVGSYELPWGFSIGGRFRVISGLPRTPVTGRVFDSVNGDFQPVFGTPNSIHLPMITLLDARVDKTFKIGKGKLIIFVDVMNVLNRPPSEEIIYDTSYTQKSYLTGLPIVADFGLRGEL